MSSSSGSGSSNSALRIAVGAGLAALAIGTTAAIWVQLARREKRRRRARGPAELSKEMREVLDEECLLGNLDEDLQQDFAAAVAWVGACSSLATQTKLKLYGCYKQVAVGDAPEEQARGGMEASYKWEAWAAVRGTSRGEAVRRYVAALDEAVPNWRESCEVPESEEGNDAGGMAMGLSVSTMGNIGDPDKEGDFDDTPVGQLCEKIAEGDIAAVRQILKRRPDLAFEADKDGMTPLHWAADRGCLEVAGMLVEMANQSSDTSCLSLQDESGDTPLHYAVLTENEAVVQLLLTARADPSCANEDGDTPLSLAQDAGMDELFE